MPSRRAGPLARASGRPDRGDVGPAANSALHLSVTALSIAGRRVDNQDRAFHAVTHNGRGMLLAVADGMGGYAGGEIASGVAADRVAQLARDLAKVSYPRQLRALLPRPYRQTARKIHSLAAETADLSEMGTTLALAAVLDGQYVVANVGDSRVYHLGARDLRRITQDHTAAAESDSGGTLQGDSDDSVELTHVLSRVLDAHACPDVDIFPKAQQLVRLEPGDVLLLCSDGLHGAVPDERIEYVLRNANSLEEAVRYLIELAVAMGGADNVTVVAAGYGDWRARRGKLPSLRTSVGRMESLSRKALIPLTIAAIALIVATYMVATRHISLSRPAGAAAAGGHHTGIHAGRRTSAKKPAARSSGALRRSRQ